MTKQVLDFIQCHDRSEYKAQVESNQDFMPLDTPVRLSFCGKTVFESNCYVKSVFIKNRETNCIKSIFIALNENPYRSVVLYPSMTRQIELVLKVHKGETLSIHDKTGLPIEYTLEMCSTNDVD